MGQMANIAVFDGATVPVVHLFNSISITRDKNKITAFYRETTLGVPVYANGTIALSIEILKSGVHRVEQRVVLPVMEAVSGQNAAGYTAAPKVAYENTIVTTGYFHPRSTFDGRRLIRQMSINLAGGITTTVPVTKDAPSPDMIDYLMLPT